MDFTIVSIIFIYFLLQGNDERMTPLRPIKPANWNTISCGCYSWMRLVILNKCENALISFAF